MAQRAFCAVRCILASSSGYSADYERGRHQLFGRLSIGILLRTGASLWGGARRAGCHSMAQIRGSLEHERGARAPCFQPPVGVLPGGPCIRGAYLYAAWQGYHEPLRTWLILSQPLHLALIPAALLVLSTWLTALALWLLGERYSLWRGVFFVALLSYGLLPFYLLQYLVTGDFSPTVFYKLPLCFGLVPLWLTIIYYASLCKRFDCR